MLEVGCGSAAASAWRALMAATICCGVACVGVAGISSQKPRALMISAGVCGLSVAACFEGWCGRNAVWTSADASLKAEAGFGRGIGIESAEGAGVAEAAVVSLVAWAAGEPSDSSSSSADLLRNSASRKFDGLLLDRAVVIPVVAALLDVGLRQLIAGQRIAIGGDMHGAAIREDAHQLVVAHARPVPDTPGVEMNEGRARCRDRSRRRRAAGEVRRNGFFRAPRRE